MKIIAFSDTHWFHSGLEIPKCDVLIFAGDANIGSERRMNDFVDWLNSQSAKHKIFVAGNHDSFCEAIGINYCKEFFGKIHYLINESIVIKGVKIWGSPYSVEYNNWSFMEYDSELAGLWNTIPDETDIVITHGPCKGILDKSTLDGRHCGSDSLRDKLKRIKPKIHICGHLHSAHGHYTDYVTDYYNVSVLNDKYELTYKPTVIEYGK